SGGRFSQPVVRLGRTDCTSKPPAAIAHAGTAGSALHPFLAPSLVDIPGKGTLQLTDGGVFDNLGLEPVVKRCATVFVSDGGGTFKVDPNPKRDWIRATLRVLDTVDVEVRRLRRRQIVGLLASRQRRGAFMAINTDYSRFPQRSPALPAGEGATKALSRTPTRLKKIDPTVRRQLVNWGYAACDAALRSYVDKELSDPPGFPYPTEGVG
ncbi:patatin-like phospholipase family protein, partial [Mycolicibacterium fortuitum]